MAQIKALGYVRRRPHCAGYYSDNYCPACDFLRSDILVAMVVFILKGEKRMKRMGCLLGIIAAIFFMLGRISVKPEIQIVEKIVTEECLPYWDLTTLTEQKVRVAASLFGKTLNSIKEVEKLRNQIWQAGYGEGYRMGLKGAF